MTYQPTQPKTPLIRRPAGWSQGVPVSALLAVAVLGVPIVYFVVLTIVALRAWFEAAVGP